MIQAIYMTKMVNMNMAIDAILLDVNMDFLSSLICTVVRFFARKANWINNPKCHLLTLLSYPRENHNGTSLFCFFISYNGNLQNVK